MKLAEALAERAEVQTRLTQVRQRLTRGARIQEGDVPAEEPQPMLAECERLLSRLQELMAQINATNATTAFDEHRTITDAIATRDVESMRFRFYNELADAAAERQDRYSRSEVKFVPTVDIAAIRALADASAKRYRELDTKLQQLNWSTDLR